MTESELTTRVTQELKGLSTNFVAADYTYAVDAAEAETGFTLPTSVTDQIRWLVQRTKRHLLYALWIQNAAKFKIKQLSLNQKFDNLTTLIRSMDVEYENALKDITFGSTASSWAYFGSKIDAGFLNDSVTGEDLTYYDENVVTITPTGEENL